MKSANIFTGVLCWLNLHKWKAFVYEGKSHGDFCEWCYAGNPERDGRRRVRGGIVLFILGACVGVWLMTTKRPPVDLPLIVVCLVMGAAIGGAISWWKGMKSLYVRQMAKEFMEGIIRRPK